MTLFRITGVVESKSGKGSGTLDWIRRRAAEVRNDERNEHWRAHKARVIESHSHEFFAALTALMVQSVAAVNAEFAGDNRAVVVIEKSLNRFVLTRPAPASVQMECRLDYAAHAVRYRLVRHSRVGTKTFTYESELAFDMNAKNEVLLLSPDAVPMSLEQTTQLLLEPFF